jgi:hypothetical protein
MARIIPNENSWVGFATTIAATDLEPTAAEVAAAEELTPFLISINASSQGNTVPTPSLDSLFETSVPGTSTATFTADFYRDTTTDTAWDTLPRGTAGYFIISRFGGTGTANLPVATNEVEVWPVTVTSRSNSNMTSNQVLTFTLTCSVNIEPNEAAIVAA